MMINETTLTRILNDRQAPPVKIQEILDEITTEAVKDPEIYLAFDEPMETTVIRGNQKVLVRGGKRILLCMGANAEDKARSLKAEICDTLATEICKPLYIKRAIRIDKKTVWRKVPYEPVITVAPIGAADARLSIDAAIATHQKPQTEIIDMIFIANGLLRGEVDRAEAKLKEAQAPQVIDFSKSEAELKFQKKLYDENIAYYKSLLDYQKKESAEKIAKNNKLIADIQDCGDEKFWLTRRSGASWRVTYFDAQEGGRRQVSCGDFIIFYNNNSEIDQDAFANALRACLKAPRAAQARADILHFDQRDKGFVGCFHGIGGKKGHETKKYFMVRRIDPKRTRF